MHNHKYQSVQINKKLCHPRRNNIIIIISLSLIILSYFGWNNCISYLYTILLISIINLFFPSHIRYNNFLCFEFYLLVALIIFSVQLYNIPTYLGLSGPEGGIGTDDIRYFEKLVDIPIGISSSASWVESYPFTDFLNIIYPFTISSPLNIVIFNLVGTCFIPSLTNILAVEITGKSKIGKQAALLILLCPFLWSNTLIIMRDGWTVSMVLLIYILVYKRKYVLSIIPYIFLGYLRFGSVFFALIGSIIILKYNVFNKNKKYNLLFWILICLGVLCFFLGINYLVEFSAGRIETSLFRETFIESLKRDDENGVITRIAQFPVFIRTPLLFVFFYFTPFFRIQFYTLNVFNIRFIFDTFLSAIWMFICLKPLFKSIYIAFEKNIELRIIVWISIYLALALSIISLQIRHKLVMMPIIAILAAMGMNLQKTKYDNIFALISVSIIIFEIIFSLR